jgi:hypothetical protein
VASRALDLILGASRDVPIRGPIPLVVPNVPPKVLGALALAMSSLPRKYASKVCDEIAMSALDLVADGLDGQNPFFSDELWGMSVLGPELSAKGALFAATRALELIPTAQPRQLRVLASLTADLPGRTGSMARERILTRTQELVGTVDPIQLEDLAWAATELPASSAPALRDAIADRALQLVPSATLNESWTLARVAMALQEDAGSKVADAVAAQTLELVRRSPGAIGKRLGLLIPSPEDLSPHLSEKGASAVADIALSILETSEESVDLDMALSFLASAATKLDARTLTQAMRQQHLFGRNRLQLLAALRDKLVTTKSPRWERPWDLADWLETHQSRSPAIAETLRLLREPLLPAASSSGNGKGLAK